MGLISAAIAGVGILVSAVMVVNQMRLQRRLSYIGTMLGDSEIASEYKIFLKDLRFLYEVLSVFPNIDINDEIVKLALENEASSLKVEYITTYIRQVLSDTPRLSTKYARLSENVKEKWEPREIFVSELLSEIRMFILSIAKGLTFHPARAWFVALFSPADRRRNIIVTALRDYRNLLRSDQILYIEDQTRRFILGQW